MRFSGFFRNKLRVDSMGAPVMRLRERDTTVDAVVALMEVLPANQSRQFLGG